MMRFDTIISFHVRHDVICFKLGKCLDVWKRWWRSNSLDCVSELAVKNLSRCQYQNKKALFTDSIFLKVLGVCVIIMRKERETPAAQQSEAELSWTRERGGRAFEKVRSEWWWLWRKPIAHYHCCTVCVT